LKFRWKQIKDLALAEPKLIVSFPDVGFAGKQAVDYLIKELKAELLAEGYSIHFPPHVLIKKEGLIEPLKCELYGWKNPRGSGDLIILTGTAQPTSPEGQYGIAQEALNKVERYGVREVYSLTGYFVEFRSPDREPVVYAAATSGDLLRRLTNSFGLTRADKGTVEGVQGTIIGEAKVRRLNGVCLLVETPGFSTPSGRMIVDARASKALLKVLSRILELELDLSGLEKQATLTEELLERLEKLEQKFLEQALRGKPASKEKQYYV
jgi:hypothetical protein